MKGDKRNAIAALQAAAVCLRDIYGENRAGIILYVDAALEARDRDREAAPLREPEE